MTDKRHFLSRITLLFLAAIFVLMAMSPVLRWTVARSGEDVTGANVRVGNIQTQPWTGKVDIAGFTAADPQNENHDLFAVDQIELTLDRRSLANKRFVVKEAMIRGLKLGADRAEGGAMTVETSREYMDGLDERFSRFGVDWMRWAAKKLGEDAPATLPSTALAEELLGRWPNELESIETETRELAGRLVGIDHGLEGSGDNPLRNAQHFQVALVDADALADQLTAVRGELDRVEQQILMDQEAVQAARKQDENSVRAGMRVRSLNGDDLNEYFLGEEVAGHVVQTIQWLRWGRQFLPALSKRSLVASERGEDIFFGGDPQPQIVIEQAMLNGSCPSAIGEVTFEGKLTNLSSQPQLASNPTEIVVQTTSGLPCLIQATLNSQKEGVQDHIQVNCPRYSQGHRSLGQPHQMAIDVAPTESHVWMDLSTHGDQIRGELIIKTPQARLTAHTENQYRCTQVADILRRAVAKIDRIEAVVEITGTLDHPQWSIRSNLGAELGTHLESTLVAEVAAQKHQALARAYAETDDRIAALNQLLAEKRSIILDALVAGNAGLERVRSRIANRIELTDGLIDEASPLRETLQR